MRDLRHLSRHRQIKQEIELYGQVGDDHNGCFAIKSPVDGKALRVIASNNGGWEHVSVSKINKVPSWAEMELVKRMFFKPDEVCMQLHVAESEHISYHPNCLHIWRPIGETVTIPLPPTWMVGPKAS